MRVSKQTQKYYNTVEYKNPKVIKEQKTSRVECMLHCVRYNDTSMKTMNTISFGDIYVWPLFPLGRLRVIQ